MLEKLKSALSLKKVFGRRRKELSIEERAALASTAMADSGLYDHNESLDKD